MRATLSLPVLPLDDAVVLPTMVVPVEINDAEVRAAIEAARVSVSGKPRDPKPQLLLVPRLGGKYSPVRPPGLVSETGRVPSGQPGPAVPGPARGAISTGPVPAGA